MGGDPFARSFQLGGCGREGKQVLELSARRAHIVGGRVELQVDEVVASGETHQRAPYWRHVIREANPGGKPVRHCPATAVFIQSAGRARSRATVAMTSRSDSGKGSGG